MGQLVNRPVAITTNPTIPGPETSPWYWNPNRIGAYEAPAWFMAKVRDVDPDRFISINWNPVIERWGVWYKKPSVNHKLVQGWTLLFVVRNDDGSYRPLDERILARLYEASGAKWGNGKQYFAAIVREQEREKERREAADLQETIDRAMPFFEHSQIKNIGKGNKFSRYHA